MVCRMALLSSANRGMVARRRRRMGRIRMRIAETAPDPEGTRSRLGQGELVQVIEGQRLRRVKLVAARVLLEAVEQLAGYGARVQTGGGVEGGGEQAAFAHARFEDGAEFVIAVEVVDQLHDGAEGSGRVV